MALEQIVQIARKHKCGELAKLAESLADGTLPLNTDSLAKMEKLAMESKYELLACLFCEFLANT